MKNTTQFALYVWGFLGGASALTCVWLSVEIAAKLH
jgi:hypothetical protein